jgi:phosphatidylglycerophosphate synthase
MAAAWGVSVDTFDGALAKRMGPTRAGPTLDIESDSWLTLCAAVAAVCWGRLPGWTVLPSIVRYAHPLIALRRKDLPVGGGPWWGRLTGGSQTALQLVVLAPFLGTWRDWLARRACVPISGGQLLAMLLLFRTTGRS